MVSFLLKRFLTSFGREGRQAAELDWPEDFSATRILTVGGSGPSVSLTSEIHGRPQTFAYKLWLSCKVLGGCDRHLFGSHQFWYKASW